MYHKSTRGSSGKFRIGGSEKRGYWPIPALHYMEFYAVAAQLATAASLWKTVYAILQGDTTFESAIQRADWAWNHAPFKREMKLSSRAGSAYRNLPGNVLSSLGLGN